MPIKGKETHHHNGRWGVSYLESAVHCVECRCGYRLRLVQKTRPGKNPSNRCHLRERPSLAGPSGDEPDTLRISIDTKATVIVGEYSRNGHTCAAKPEKALYHDMSPKAIPIPFGVLEISRGKVAINQPWILLATQNRSVTSSLPFLSLLSMSHLPHHSAVARASPGVPAFLCY